MTVSHAGEVDPSVIERARGGDQRAFAELVGHYDRRLRALAFRLLGDRSRMDDVLQEAYVKAYRALPQFRTGAAPGTWLYRITYNACIDELRRVKRQRLEPFTDVDAERETGEGPELAVTERSVLEDALASLSHDQRAAVMLIDAEGFDYASAAEVLGIAEKALGSRLLRARAALRRALTEKEEPDE